MIQNYWLVLHRYQHRVDRPTYFRAWVYLMFFELAWLLVWFTFTSVYSNMSAFGLMNGYGFGLSLALPPFISTQIGRLIDAGWPRGLAITFNVMSYFGAVLCPPLLISGLGTNQVFLAGMLFLLVWLYSFVTGGFNIVMFIFCCLPSRQPR